jgi:hypothetical protein
MMRSILKTGSTAARLMSINTTWMDISCAQMKNVIESEFRINQKIFKLLIEIFNVDIKLSTL